MLKIILVKFSGTMNYFGNLLSIMLGFRFRVNYLGIFLSRRKIFWVLEGRYPHICLKLNLINGWANTSRAKLFSSSCFEGIFSSFPFIIWYMFITNNYTVITSYVLKIFRHYRLLTQKTITYNWTWQTKWLSLSFIYCHN